jgi:hypothetical protein
MPPNLNNNDPCLWPGLYVTACIRAQPGKPQPVPVLEGDTILLAIFPAVHVETYLRNNIFLEVLLNHCLTLFHTF